MPSPVYQPTFDDLGMPLYAATFVVLDIETTGGSPQEDCITEIGAIKSVGGQIIGTFETLVRPEGSIPAFIELLTGISDTMVRTAPPIQQVLPSLWEFLRGSTLVAHNARFDSGFLTATFRRYGYKVPFEGTVCTLRMARWLMRGETRDMRLQTLAASLGSPTTPCHRAFPDARATHDVFHRLLELAGPLGILTCEDLFAFNRMGPRPDISKVQLAARLPRAPGVYQFVDKSGRVIYVGKAKDLRSRVRSYFYGDERPKTRDLIREVGRIDHEVMPTEIAAECREIELIRRHQPKYNSRGRRRSSTAWIKVTAERIPRLVVARVRDPNSRLLGGPFASQTAARRLVDAIVASSPLPRCSQPAKHPRGCAFGDMGQCLAPCKPENVPAHRLLIEQVIQDVSTGGAGIMTRLHDKMLEYSHCGRYEEAATTRDRMRLVYERVSRDAVANSMTAAGLVTVVVPREGGYEVTEFFRGSLVSSEVLERPFPSPRLTVSEQPLSGWPTREDHEDALMMWRYLGWAAARGGWVSGVTGSLALPVRQVPEAAKAASRASKAAE